MENRELTLILVLIAMLQVVVETIIFLSSPSWIEYYWVFGGLLWGLVATLLLLIKWRGWVPKNRVEHFAPIASGTLLVPLSWLLVKMGFISAPIGFFLGVSGMALLLFGLYHLPKVKASIDTLSNRKTVEAIASKTPKGFLKSCVACGRQIPIASEECPFCQAKQP